MTTSQSQALPDPFKRHRLDLAAVETGKWVDLRGDRWLVASLSSVARAKARGDAMIARGLAPDAEIPPHLEDTITGEVFANAILRGCKLQDDPSRVYEPSLGLRIWSDPELRDLRTALVTAAGGDYTQEAVAKAALLGNC